MNIKSLVFEGGGVKGLCYVGALAQMEKLNLIRLNRMITHVGGTSAGAIIATLIASHHTVSEMTDILFHMDWSKLKDGNFNLFRLLRKFGYYKGDYFEKFINKVLYDKLKLNNPTFKQLYMHTGRHLKMVGNK